MKLLLGRRGVSPSRPDKDSWASLGCATVGGEGVVGLLLYRKDVSPNRPDKNDQTLLGWAAAKEHEGAVKLLLEQEMSTLLGCASVRGHLVLKIIDAEVMIGGEGFIRQSGTA